MLDPMCMSEYNKITGISGYTPDVSEMTESRSLPVSCAEAGKSYIQKYKRSVQWHPEMMYDSEEQLKLLAANGMLVKRPLIVDGATVLTGFKEAEWTEKLL